LAQGKYGNYWVFSHHLGLNFNAGNIPNADTSSIYGPRMPTASICDQLGNLTCYVGTWNWADFDIRLYNKFHSLVKGGDQLFVQSAGQYTQFSGYTALLPFSEDVDSLMLVKFSVNYISNNHNLNYSLIDTKAYGDTGVIYSANNKVIDFKGVIGTLGCIRHANGRDWWILIHGYPNNIFYKFLASPWKVEFVEAQSIGTVFGILDTTFSNLESMGEISFNLDGDRIGINNMGGLIETYEFDRCTGLLSNAITLQTVNFGNSSLLNTRATNLSPNGRFLYGISYYNSQTPLGNILLGKIIQYDLLASNPSIDTNEVYVFKDSNSFLDHLEYGPDGRMWFIGRGDPALYNNLQYPQDSFMHFIEFPDVKGLACNVKINQVYMKGRKAMTGLPNMPNYNLGPIDGSICDTLGLDVGVYATRDKDILHPRVYPNPSHGSGAVLRIPQGERTHRIYIYDVTGKLVWEIQSDSGTVQLPGFLPPGLYQVVVGEMEGVRWRVE
jgi:hypothetical protein